VRKAHSIGGIRKIYYLFKMVRRDLMQKEGIMGINE
jgi:hypothetical protein